VTPSTWSFSRREIPGIAGGGSTGCRFRLGSVKTTSQDFAHVPDRVKPEAVICNFWHPGILTLRVSARISKITNDGLTRSGTGCCIAVLIRQQRQRVNWSENGREKASPEVTVCRCSLCVTWSLAAVSVMPLDSRSDGEWCGCWDWVYTLRRAGLAAPRSVLPWLAEIITLISICLVWQSAGGRRRCAGSSLRARRALHVFQLRISGGRRSGERAVQYKTDRSDPPWPPPSPRRAMSRPGLTSIVSLRRIIGCWRGCRLGLTVDAFVTWRSNKLYPAGPRPPISRRLTTQTVPLSSTIERRRI